MIKKISLILFFSSLFFITMAYADNKFKLGKLEFNIETAVTPEAQHQGLSGRQALAPNQAMLFVFPKTDIYPFWMKDMLFPIDIIWLDKDYNIVYVVENAQPCSDSNHCPSLIPAKPALYVLETSAGTFKRL